MDRFKALLFDVSFKLDLIFFKKRSEYLVKDNEDLCLSSFSDWITEAGVTGYVYSVLGKSGPCMHSKSGISWMEKSADDLEFSAEGLSGNAKTIKFALLEEPGLYPCSTKTREVLENKSDAREIS